MFTKPINRWWTVLAGAMGCAGGAGVIATYVFGIFIKAIAAEYGWNRSATTASISCFFLASGIGSIVLGGLVSRWAVRVPTIVFVFLFSLSIAAVAILPPSLLFFCLTFAVMGFFGAGATAMPYGIAISGWFDHNRGLALAVAVSGTGVAGAFMSRYANWLMVNYGWRGGYVGVALFVGIIGLSGLIFFFREGRLPERTEKTDDGPTMLALFRSDWTFWKISISIFLISLTLIGIITNLPAILTDRGESMGTAAAVLGIVGASSWFSRIGLGLLLDRVHVRYISAAIFLMIAAGVGLILLDVKGPWLALAAAMIGLGMGSEADLVTFTVSRYFAPRALGRAMGGVWIFWAWGSALGVSLGSLSYDLTHSYAAALAGFSLFALVSGALMMRLGAYTFAAEHGGKETMIAPAFVPAE